MVFKNQHSNGIPFFNGKIAHETITSLVIAFSLLVTQNYLILKRKM